MKYKDTGQEIQTLRQRDANTQAEKYKQWGKPLLLFPCHNRWRAALKTQTVPNLGGPPSPAFCLEHCGQ